MKVSDGLWDRLEEKLDQVPAKEEKPKIVWLRYAAVILLMIGLGGSFLMINSKSDIKDNQEFVNQTENKNPNSNLVKSSEKNEVGKKNPINNSSETDNKRLAVENKDSSTPLRMTEEIKNVNQVSEKEVIVKNNEPQIIPKSEEKLAQNDILTSLSTQKPEVKYVSSSDLLFGVEIDKAKTETPKSAMGINISKSKIDSDFPNPKRIKLFGITLYDKDSITTK